MSLRHARGFSYNDGQLARAFLRKQNVSEISLKAPVKGCPVCELQSSGCPSPSPAWGGQPWPRGTLSLVSLLKGYLDQPLEGPV